MTTTTIKISVTVSPSILSSARVATLTSPYAMNQMSAAATREIRSHSAFGQMPVPSKKACPKRPTSAVDAAVKAPGEVGQAGHQVPHSPVHTSRMHAHQHLIVSDLGL